MTVTPPAGEGAQLPDDTDTGSGSTGSGVAWPTEAELDAQLAVEPGEEVEVDGEETPPPAATETPAPETGTPDPAAVPDPDPGTPPAEVGGLAELPPTWQAEVRKLRDEAAEGRVETKRYRDAFDGWPDADVDGFLEIAKGIASADQAESEAAARRLILGGKAVLEGLGIDVGDIAAPDPNRPMTRAEFVREQARMDAEREEARLKQENLDLITKTVTGLGYEIGSLDHYALLRAANDLEGDIPSIFEKADEMVKAHHKAIVENAIAEMQGKRAKHLKTQPAVGSAPAPERREPPKTMDEAVARFMEEDYGDVLT